MKKVLPIACLFLMSCFVSIAQVRYLDEVFDSVSVETDIMYGQNYTIITGAVTMDSLYMDVYSPVGDTVSERPVVILVHGGSFLPASINGLYGGDKNDLSVIEMANQFAKRGWVAVSMDYRLGWNPLAQDQEDRASTIIQAVYRSMQDVKNCVRFFKYSASSGNTYGVDTSRITLLGDGSGGYSVVTAATLDDTLEMQLFKFVDSQGNSFVDINTLGDFDGFNGAICNNNYQGYSSDFQLVVNLGGAIGDTSWQEAGEVPMLAFHGQADLMTPYGTDIVIVASTQDPVVEVSGSFDFMTQANTLGNQSVLTEFSAELETYQGFSNATSVEGLYGFVGAANGFNPWGWYDTTDYFYANSMALNPYASESRAKLYIDTIMSYLCPRAAVVLELEEATSEMGLSVQELPELGGTLTVFPNPIADHVRVYFSNSNNPILSILIFDVEGRLVATHSGIQSHYYDFNKGNLNSGNYLMTVNFKEGSASVQVVVE